MFGKKVGVLTFHKCINYGSYWQARCLVEALGARGFDAELLDHDCRCVRRAEARCALQSKLPQRTPACERRRYLGKVRRFVEAIAALPQSRRFSLHRANGAPAYDAIVVGSDEVWNFRHPWYASKPIFFGDGLKADRFVSYAASFGNHSAWDGIDNEWAEKLDRFGALSVRDENSWHLVKGGTGREAEMVLDPVLQFGEVSSSPEPGDRFALVYGHGFSDWLQAAVRRWADCKGMRVISVGYANDWADEQLIDVGPIEFPQIVASSSAVITNFFHGCVFAVLTGRPWVAVPSDYRSIKIPDLAKLLGVTDRIADDGWTDAQLADALSAPGHALNFDEHRARSKAFLDAALY